MLRMFSRAQLAQVHTVRPRSIERDHSGGGGSAGDTAPHPMHVVGSAGSAVRSLTPPGYVSHRSVTATPLSIIGRWSRTHGPQV